MAEKSAPKCPWWCRDGEHGVDGWDQGELSKTCRRLVPTIEDMDGDQIVIALEQFFAATEQGDVEEQTPTIRIEGHGLITVDDALASAYTVIRVVEMVNEPPPLAAAS